MCPEIAPPEGKLSARVDSRRVLAPQAAGHSGQRAVSVKFVRSGWRVAWGGFIALGLLLPLSLAPGLPAVADQTVVQLGEGINGDQDSGRFGWSIALNALGDRIVVGTPGFRNGEVSGSGRAQVFRWDGSQWLQLGQDILRLANENHSFGISVAMSADGDRVAIGAENAGPNEKNQSGSVSVYQWDGSAWTPLGSEIPGTNAFDKFGFSVALSADGSRLAVGAPTNSDGGSGSGHVRVFEWNAATSLWELLGSAIPGSAAGDRSARVSLSADGNRVAIGAAYHDDAGDNAGQVRVFRWDGTAWALMGSELEGDAEGDKLGHSVALSADGTRLAAGAEQFTTGPGYVRTFQWDGSSWQPLGSDVIGNNLNDLMGHSVALNFDGTRLVVGARSADAAGTNSGLVRVLDWNGEEWALAVADVPGSAAGEDFGFSVATNSSGTIFAAGAPENSEVASSAGQVRVFQFAQATNETTANPHKSPSTNSGEPGIFLTLSEPQRGGSAQLEVTYGSYAVAPHSPYVLSVSTGPAAENSRVVASGRANPGGHLESRVIFRPGSSGVHTLVLTAQGRSGELLVLGNRIEVNSSGEVVSVSSEDQQPRIR